MSTFHLKHAFYLLFSIFIFIISQFFFDVTISYIELSIVINSTFEKKQTALGAILQHSFLNVPHQKN